MRQKMKIKWLGQATFVIESKDILVTDPYNPMLGKLPKDLTASVITVSHPHMDHNYVKGIGGNPQIIKEVGSFKIGGFEIKGIPTFHDNIEGKKRGNNVVYVIRSEGITLCHLGDLGHALNEEQLKEIGPVDILMIPVGGTVTIGPAEAVEVVSRIKPKIVLPMHYKAGRSLIPLPLATVDKFTNALGWAIEEVDELEIDQTTINSFDSQVIVFQR